MDTEFSSLVVRTQLWLPWLCPLFLTFQPSSSSSRLPTSSHVGLLSPPPYPPSPSPVLSRLVSSSVSVKIPGRRFTVILFILTSLYPCSVCHPTHNFVFGCAGVMVFSSNFLIEPETLSLTSLCPEQYRTLCCLIKYLMRYLLIWKEIVT